MKPYGAAQFSGKQWGVFHVQTRSWCMFGPEDRMKKRADVLNAQEMMTATLVNLKQNMKELES